jgi:hypothetical protein
VGGGGGVDNQASPRDEQLPSSCRAQQPARQQGCGHAAGSGRAGGAGRGGGGGSPGSATFQSKLVNGADHSAPDLDCAQQRTGGRGGGGRGGVRVGAR